jgi:hypothetical protein
MRQTDTATILHYVRYTFKNEEVILTQAKFKRSQEENIFPSAFIDPVDKIPFQRHVIKLNIFRDVYTKLFLQVVTQLEKQAVKLGVLKLILSNVLLGFRLAQPDNHSN